MKKLQLKTKLEKKLKRGGLAGMAVGVLTLIACELPIVLAIIGIGGFGASLAAFRPPLYIEVIGVISFVAGVGVLVYVYRKRHIERRKARSA